MRILVGLMLSVTLVAAAAFWYQHPRVQSLFSSPGKQERPLAFLENLPALTPKPKVVSPKVKAKPLVPSKRRDAAEPVLELAEPQNQVPNAELARVLLQILAARKVAGGLSLQVTDDTIQLFGEVGSLKEKRQILEIIEKAREARRVEDEHLKVRDSDH